MEMKKISAFLFLFSLCILLGACASQTPDNISSAAQQPQTPIPVVDAPADVPDQILTEETGDAYALEELMAEVLRIQAGASGCSLRAVSCAVKFMDWGTTTSMTEEEIYNAVAVYLSSMSESELVDYLEQLKLLDSSYLQLLAPGQEELLESAGCTDTGYPWSSEPIWAVEQFMIATTVRQTSQISLSSANMEGLYSDYLFYSHRVLLEGESAADSPVPINYTVLMEHRAADGLHSLGYCLYDINLDGLDELLIGSVEQPTVVYDIVSLVDGQVTPIFQGWARNAAHICTDGTIAVLGSGGAAYTRYTYYSLQNGQLSHVGSIIFDAASSPNAPWFYTADTDEDLANDTPITEEQALSFTRQYESTYISFDFSPFAIMGLHP